MASVDCIVIGYNDLSFDQVARQHKPLERVSASYGELTTNSVRVGGRRLNYMELLNHVVELRDGINPELNAFRVPNLGAVYLVNYLRRAGYIAELVNLFNYERASLRALLDERPAVVAITTTYYVDDAPIKELVNVIRSINETVSIVVGGPFVLRACATHPESLQHIIFQSIGADVYINDSQGERTLARVVSSVRSGGTEPLHSVPNLIYRKESGFARTQREIEQNDLNANAIDWSRFPSSFYAPTVYMRTARSCPYSCAFCNYPSMSGAHTLTDLDVVRNELRLLADNGVKTVIFVDDTFNVPLPRFKQLCRNLIEDKLNLNWISFFRCGNADEEAFELMARSGCMAVYLGIESGDDRMLRNMNKKAATRLYQLGIRALHQRGIITFGSFIVGYPGETAESVQNTLRFLDETPTTFYNVQLYFHDSIAPIEQRRAEFGIEGAHYNWKHNSMTWQEGLAWVKQMRALISKSLPLPLYGFSIWSLPYLIDQGLSIEQIKAFARVSRDISIKTQEDTDGVSVEAELDALSAALVNWSPHAVA